MIYFLLALFVSLASFASERILLFKSDIALNQDGTMKVVETIRVQSWGLSIRHGIVREFPTTYTDRWGNKYTVAFQVKGATRGAQDELYHIANAINGKKIYIGERDTLLLPGIYTYTIEYEVGRHLGFFESHDELYWNITGNGWRLPIVQAKAIIRLPEQIPRTTLTFEAYTGYQGQKGQDVQSFLDDDGNIVFETTRPFQPYEGLTAVVTWPKGYITQPTSMQRWGWFFDDNLDRVILLMGILLLLLWYFFAWRNTVYLQSRSTIIPLFYPPESCPTPGLMRYIVKMGYDATVLAADIVAMAVHGFLTIEYSKKGGWWGGNHYILHKKKKPFAKYEQYQALYEIFFIENDSCAMTKANAFYVQRAIQEEEDSYQEATRSYFSYPGWVEFGGVIMSILFFLLLISVTDQSGLLTFAFIVHAGVNILFGNLLKHYTKKGVPIKNEIDGFKMFLEATEKERLKIIGTPPTQTPKLYETYLPYAIALGVEEQWSRQFASLFEQMRQAGTPYVFVWFADGHFRSFDAPSFAHGISSSINSISSSSQPSGWGSGSGGSGSSGGGSGGGGGGGW